MTTLKQFYLILLEFKILPLRVIAKQVIKKVEKSTAKAVKKAFHSCENVIILH